jgi:Skp family chaperone for outer membrane proteins
MKKLTVVALLSCASLAFASAVQKNGSVTSENKPVKFGVVSVVEIGNAEESKHLQNELGMLRSKWESEIVKIDQELQKIANDLNSAKQAGMSAKQEELQEKGLQKQQERENKAKEAERTMQREAQKLIGASQENFQKAVEKVAEKQNVDFVFQKEALLYVKKGTSFDITKDVVVEWDAAYNASKPKPAAPVKK